MRSLVVFDIDGTLIDSRVVDTDACFFPALREALGIEGFGDDWTGYAEPTSAGVFDEICRKVRGRPPTDAEAAALTERLEVLMRARYLDGTRIPAIPGAIELLARLGTEPAWRVAVATGNWSREAAIKIESAGLPLAGLPLATASDRPARTDIFPLAVERASAHYGVPAWDRVVFVGDGIWDVRAARANGYAFVGIALGERAAKLHAEGARAVTRDLTDPDRVLALLAEAVPPGPAFAP